MRKEYQVRYRFDRVHSRRYIPLVGLVGLLVGLGLLGGAGVVAANSSAVPAAPQDDAFVVLRPETGAPPNGGTVSVGARFVLAMLVNTGRHDNVAAFQTYLTFTYGNLQNARVSSIGTSCTLTSELSSLWKNSTTTAGASRAGGLRAFR